MIANQQRLRWGSTSIGDPNKSRKGKSGVKKEQFILESFVTYQQTNLGRVLFAHYLVRVFQQNILFGESWMQVLFKSRLKLQHNWDLPK